MNVRSGTLYAYNTTFHSNSATVRGGAVYLHSSNATFSYCNFSKNEAMDGLKRQSIHNL